MNYRKIDHRVQKLTPNEAFTYICLLSKTDFITYESHIKQANLLIFINEMGLKMSEKTLRNHLNKFKEVGLIEINDAWIKGNKGVFLRNTYKINTEHYELLDVSILKLNIPAKTIGFLAILWTLSFNFSNYTALNNTQIVERTRVGKNSISGFVKEAVNAGLLQKKKGRLIFKNEEIFIKSIESEESMAKRIYPEVFDDGFN